MTEQKTDVPDEISVDDDFIAFHCPQCGKLYGLHLAIARYYLRSHDSLQCIDCKEKFKPHCLDIFVKLLSQRRLE